MACIGIFTKARNPKSKRNLSIWRRKTCHRTQGNEHRYVFLNKFLPFVLMRIRSLSNTSHHTWNRLAKRFIDITRHITQSVRAPSCMNIHAWFVYHRNFILVDFPDVHTLFSFCFSSSKPEWCIYIRKTKNNRFNSIITHFFLFKCVFLFWILVEPRRIKW